MYIPSRGSCLPEVAQEELWSHVGRSAWAGGREGAQLAVGVVWWGGCLVLLTTEGLCVGRSVQYSCHTKVSCKMSSK